MDVIITKTNINVWHTERNILERNGSPTVVAYPNFSRKPAVFPRLCIHNKNGKKSAYLANITEKAKSFFIVYAKYNVYLTCKIIIFIVRRFAI